MLEHDSRRPETSGGGSTTPQTFLRRIMIGATLVLVLAGLMASIVPARRAA